MAGSTSLSMAMSLSFDAACRWFYQGLLTDTEWELYLFYWRNSAPRFSETASRYDLKPELPPRFRAIR
jgi:hypothetical protein